MFDPFKEATQAAIREILEGHLESSKYGYFLSEEKLEDVTADIFELVKTSRNLKSAGDRFMGGAVPSPKPAQQPKRRSHLPWKK